MILYMNSQQIGHVNIQKLYCGSNAFQDMILLAKDARMVHEGNNSAVFEIQFCATTQAHG